jgi:ankyrin repeat protein
VDAAGPGGNSALHLAAQKGHTAMVQLLLDAGAALDAVSANGFLPLHEAADKCKWWSCC